MSNIDKQALREEFKMMQECYSDPADRDRQVIYIAAEELLDELEAKERRIEDEIGRANREHHRGFMMACGHLKEHSNVHYADAAEMEIAALRKRINELESAQPAPVSVPDEIESTSGSDFDDYYCDGWNACRAAMLQGAEHVTKAYKFPEGYALVPVEPTYQMCDAMGLPWESPRFPDRYKAMIAAAPHFLENAETSTNCPCCGRKPLKNKPCSVAGCDGKHVARGFCVKHYAIARKKDPSRRESIRAADKRYRARKAAAPRQEVK